MIVTRTSQVSGVRRSLDLPVTQEQLDNYARGGVLIQHAFPGLPKEDREFIKTGITAQEWDDMFKDVDE